MKAKAEKAKLEAEAQVPFSALVGAFLLFNLTFPSLMLLVKLASVGTSMT